MNRISSFVQFDPTEAFDREYYITHTSLKRFPARVIALMVVGSVFLLAGLYFFIQSFNYPRDQVPLLLMGLALMTVGLTPLLYYLLRRPRVSHGYATITNQRLLYYEYNDHDAENYHFVQSLYLTEITALQFKLERTLFRKSFIMAVFTEFKALAVGAEEKLGIMKIFSRGKHLEPGPDALEFIQQLAGLIAAHRFQPGSASKIGSA